MIVEWWVRWLIYLSLFGAIVRWVARGVLSTPVILLISVLLYFKASSFFGVEPLGPFELIEQFAKTLELLLAATGVVVAVVAAKVFLDSKRLDMRLAAAADFQELSQRLVDVATKQVQLAEVLVDFSKMLGSGELAQADERQRKIMLVDSLAGLQVSYANVKNGGPSVWSLVNEGISLPQKHGLALNNSLVAFLCHRKAMVETERFAELCSFAVPEGIDDFEFLWAWFQNTDQSAAEACKREAFGMAMRGSMWLGASSGALGKGVFSPSGGVAMIFLKDIRKILRED